MEGKFCRISFSADPRDPRERPHVCPQCNRQFRRLEHLQRHVRTHTKERPYLCACGLSFSRRDLLKRHFTIIRGTGKAHQHGVHHHAIDDTLGPRDIRATCQDETTTGPVQATDDMSDATAHLPTLPNPNHDFDTNQIMPEEISENDAIALPEYYSNLENLAYTWNAPSLFGNYNKSAEGSGSDGQDWRESIRYAPSISALNDPSDINPSPNQGMEVRSLFQHLLGL